MLLRIKRQLASISGANIHIFFNTNAQKSNTFYKITENQSNKIYFSSKKGAPMSFWITKYLRISF